jgi:hypothetical protein
MTRSGGLDLPTLRSALGLATFCHLALLLLGGCGIEGEGDAYIEPIADVHGSGNRIHQLVGPATWLDPDNADSLSCASPADRAVHASGLAIVAIDRFDETGDGALGNYYVEDAYDDPPPYSGITVFEPSFSPPDLRLAQNDVVDADGVLTEFLGPTSGRFGKCKTLPEIGGTLSLRFDGTPTTPKVIPVADLKSYETARPWLGMLVTLEDVVLANDPTSSGGRYAADINVGGGIEQSDVPRISNELYDLEGEGPPLAEGTQFSRVTGIITYFYGFKLAPRSPADFEP